MRLIVINYSGNVGKTMLSSQLAHALPNGQHHLLQVDGVNTNAMPLPKNSNVVKMDNFSDDVYKAIAIKQNIIVDVGSSRAYDFVENLINQEFLCKNVDRFIIPVNANLKEQMDGIRTAKDLMDAGVISDKILFVFNMVAESDTLLLRHLLDKADELRIPVAHTKLSFTPIFNILARENLSYDEFKAIDKDRFNKDFESEADEDIKASMVDMLYAIGIDGMIESQVLELIGEQFVSLETGKPKKYRLAHKEAQDLF